MYEYKTIDAFKQLAPVMRGIFKNDTTISVTLIENTSTINATQSQMLTDITSKRNHSHVLTFHEKF